MTPKIYEFLLKFIRHSSPAASIFDHTGSINNSLDAIIYGVKNKLLDSIKKQHPFLIGMVHLAPLAGHDNSPGLETIIKLALEDTQVLNGAGFDAILIENNYDIPHTEFIPDNAKEQLNTVIEKIKTVTNLPIGLCVLWNDYKTALDIACEQDLAFVRIPVFVDKVETMYGFTIDPNYKAIKKYQTDHHATKVCIFTDVQVKHSTLLNPRPLSEAVEEAEKEGSNGIIITGKWTGDRPLTNDLEIARLTTKLPIIVGSGADKSNIAELKKYADVIIVGSALKEGTILNKEVEPNLFPWQNRLNMERAKEFVLEAKKQGRS